MKSLSPLIAPALSRVACSLVAAALLVSCGGGGDAAPDGKSAAANADARRQALAIGSYVPPTPIPADAGTRGMWSPVYNWPLVAVHATLLPDGRVLTFGSSDTGQQGANAIVDVWDSSLAPDQGHLTLPNGTGTDIFCSATVLLPPTTALSAPNVFIAGGDNWTGTQTTNTANPNSNLFDASANTLTRRTDMQRARWYASAITLVNGETYIQGGISGADRPEVRGLDASFRLLSGANTTALDPNYPRNFVAPDGRVFGFDAAGWMYYVNTTANGSLETVSQFASTYASWTGSAAMFRPGRILQISGSSNAALVIDINSGAPVLSPTQSLSSQRAWVNATVLADGKVLATSGSQVANALVGVNTKAEIWNPTTGQWLQGPAAVRPRLYHSNALLLPDASVLVTGGGATVSVGTGPSDNLNSEIYYPPYLFNAAGQRAARPVIAAAPDWVDIGKVITVDVTNAASISRVTLVKTGASTHSFNMDQRFIELTYSAAGTRLSVQAPARAADATPGFYQLFVFNEAGVPSIAKMVRIGVAPVANPATVPVLAAPGAQATVVPAPVDLALVATDPNGDTLSFGASGLPPGLALNPATGHIAGTPSAAGRYDVIATASDGVNVASVSFVWTVTAPNGVLIDPLPVVVPAAAGGVASFTASASGGTNVQYRWNFGDGSADTPWSASATATHGYANPGSYRVTLTVTDDSGAVQTRSFLQTVYLPATANRPAASSDLAIEAPLTGNPRLWVANADNNSVSVFDTITRARLAEVPVGAAPRFVAVAPNGRIWVSNQRADSISVIDTATLAVVRTIALPRASQPAGVVMSPVANQAYVVLEATGQLLKFDTTSYAQLGSTAVGANPRQLSVTADGSAAYVSRFITPPLPGESTATVAPTAATGGTVVVVGTAAMTTLRTVVLQHSDRPDLENQGRGVPNYLGAAAISPDGTQAWVPSKQDNLKRGTLRDGTALNFQNTVRAVSSRIVLATGQEDLARRVDHDNSSVATAAVYDRRGVYLFVALESSREVAVVDAHAGFQVMRFDAGRAPQGLALSADGNTLYVSNFMDRTVGVFDLRPLIEGGQLTVTPLATLATVATEALAPAVLLGKQLFYDARDARLARDRYLSCASCHNDGDGDGRVWDFTGQGEGLRNTVALRGRAGAEGLLHWSANFDEVQDFEGQIRSLAGGVGLMSDAAFNAGTRSQPLGDAKAGLSTDLDALAAYVGSLASFDPTPYRNADASLSTAATAGRAVFLAKNCAACHGGAAFTNSGALGLQNIGTLKASSGMRLGGTLAGIDIPTLRDVWRTGPYLHDGSAATLDAAVLAHNGTTATATDLANLVAYLREIGAEEVVAPGSTSTIAATVAATATAADLSALGTADWAHWGDGAAPGLVRKAGGGALISAYTLLQGGAAAAYPNDLRALSWTDGAPTAASAANKNGLYVAGQGNGYTVTLPASAAARTVNVFVGGWASSATFTARLSDGSVPAFTDTTAAAAGQYVRRYTISYSAASGNAQLVLSWAQASAGGNVTLNGIALSTAAAPPPPPPPNQPPTLATPAAQSGAVGQVATLALAATDPDGDPLTYSATGLPAGLTLNATSGVVSGTPTAAGTSTVVATVQDGRGGSASATFTWTVQAAAVAGSLTGAVSTATTAVNLATVGTLDWAHWGDGAAPGLVRKATGGSQISAYTLLQGGAAVSYGNDLRALSWTGGAPTAAGTANRNGVYVAGAGNGYTLTLPAGTTSRTVTFYVGGWASSATFRAQLSDGSAAAYTNTTAAATGQYVRAYTLTFAAGSAGQQLVVSWTQASAGGNVTLNGAALR